MINETINRPDDKEFVKVYMTWLKSNEPTLTIKDDKENKIIYFRIPLNGLEYIYQTSPLDMKTNTFDYKGIYSPEKEICVINDLWGSYASSNTEEEIAKDESMGYYERERTARKFNEFFKKIIPPMFLTKYKDKVINPENKNSLDYYKDAARAAYLRGDPEVSLLDEFYKQLKNKSIYEKAFQSMCETNTQNDYYRILIDFIVKGETEKAVKEFVEEAIDACEKETPHAFTNMHDTFLMYLKKAKMIQELTKVYMPTEGERLTRSMCQAYNAFFKGKEAPKKIKITVMGANKNRNWKYKRDSIDIDGKIMQMKVNPCQLASPYVAFEPSTYGISDFTCKDLQVRKNYSGRIEIPIEDIHAEDILKIEYGRKIIWEKPEKEASKGA